MPTIEETIHIQINSFQIMIRNIRSKLDNTIFSGMSDYVQTALYLRDSPVYAWSNSIKRIVDQSCQDYPLQDAIESLHYFHKPNMVWIFDEPVLTVSDPNDADHMIPIDAVMISPYKKSESESMQSLMHRMLEAKNATPEKLRKLNDEVRANSTGVMIIGFTSLITRIPVDGLGWDASGRPVDRIIPKGSRILSAMMNATIDFGKSAANHWPMDKFIGDKVFEDETNRLKKFVLAATALIKQRILIAESQRATRAERKRLAAANLSDLVMGINLRATEHGPSATTVNGLIEWSHRWIVRGHWRKQWYPSLKEHRVIWIPSYIKGPDNLPLHVTPKVFSVSR